MSRKNHFCACGHNRSWTYRSNPRICGDIFCECVKHDTATAPKKAKPSLKVVEPGPNALARDAAVTILRAGIEHAYEPADKDAAIRAAISCLEAIS